MGSMFDFISVLLFIATAGLYLARSRHERPPRTPYLVIALVSIVGNWLGNHGAGPAAIALMVASAFLALHLASEPFRERPEDNR